MTDHQKETFTYTYSAQQQKEIQAIRAKYTAPEEQEDKMTLLRRLDARVTEKATAFSLVVGVMGALILGTGMSLIMTELSETFGKFSMPLGILIGIVGIVLVCLAYPLYNAVVRREREKIAPEIIRLTDELLK